MAAQIFHTKRVATAWTSTTAAAGFGPSNVSNESLGRPWKATGTGAEDLTITFAAAATVHTLFVHDVNFASCTVRKSADGSSFSSVGTLTTYADRDGRRRGRITINDANVRAVQLQIASGSPTDGAAAWRVGAAYPMTTQHQPPADLIFPVVEDAIDPGVSVELPNGIEASASTGVRFARLETNWQRESNESLATFLEKAKAATIIFDAGTSDYPEQQWPVFIPRKRQHRESFERFRFSRFTVPLVERV